MIKNKIYENYLSNLQMTATIKELEFNNLPRFVQLINKTNQFNLRTKRYSTAEVKGMMEVSSVKYKIIAITLFTLKNNCNYSK